MTIADNTSVIQPSGLQYTKKFVKQMLRHTIFTGVFHEKRRVDDLNAYRDIVTVSPEEEKFIQNLKIVKKKIDEEILVKHWLGITEPDTIGAPVGYNLWVVLQQEVSGKYWFKVKTVEFLDREIRLKLEILRPFDESTVSRDNSSLNEVEGLLDILRNKICIKQSLTYILKDLITFNNFKSTVTFLSILITTIIIGLFNGIQYTLEYILRLIHVLSNCIKACTPIIMGTIDFLSKIVGGFYILIHSLFKSNRNPSPVYNNYIIDPRLNPQFQNPKIRYNQYFNNRAIPYYNSNSRRGPTITPLD